LSRGFQAEREEGVVSSDMIAEQVRLYGEPLLQKFGRLLQTYRIPQSRLGAVIGLSAPMVSQLSSGQRVKISNPAVYGRLLRLEEFARTPGVATGDPQALAAALEEVASSRPTLTTQAVARPLPEATLLTELRRLAGPSELRTTATTSPSRALAEVLRRAADLP